MSEPDMAPPPPINTSDHHRLSGLQIEFSERLAGTRAEKIIGRNIALGASFREFNSLPGMALRLYFDRDSWRLDPAGDTRMREMITNTFEFDETKVEELARLTNRLFYLCKFDQDTQSSGQPLILYYKRPVRSLDHDRPENIPFDDGDEVLLFEDDMVEPRYVVVIQEIRQAANYDAASGVLLVAIKE